MRTRTRRPAPGRPFYVAEDDAPAKRRILETALELFVRDGLCETSVRDIAKASGFTNPALFKHFKSKDALARYLFERCYLELAELVSTAIASGRTFEARQRAIIDASLVTSTSTCSWPHGSARSSSLRGSGTSANSSSPRERLETFWRRSPPR